ncbi:ABC transporter permease [Actinoplanes sp. TBRC 11911]|uniref:ABC transporter permease n=1 Tax=Actinoplanes sp. TBRC 11911 TaxID=2729386 RepID=UPI00145F6087|nr:ABC transporter permease [Actinoplanes sp. TBRC 11911]NMO56241.1 ABC transporter permease [Actinoplanes sp. TBRC 11911]
MRAELTKLRTRRGPLLLLILLVAVTAAGSAMAVVDGPDPVHASLQGVLIGQAVAALAGVQLLAGEYSTGLIQTTWLAVPRRLPVLFAKSAWLLLGVSGAALLAVGASVLAGRLISSSYPALTSTTVLRAAAGSVLYLSLTALFGLGVGALLRNAPFAAGATLSALYVIPAIIPFFPDRDWQEALYRIGPSTAGLSIQTTADPASLPIGPWAGLAVTAAWALGTLASGGWLLRRR